MTATSRSPSTDNSSEMVERRANAFAAAFLMPRNGVYEALRGLDKGLPSRQEQTIFDVASGGHMDAEFRSRRGRNGSTTRTSRCSLTVSE